MIIDFTISNYHSIRKAQTVSFEATNDSTLEDYYVVTLGKYRILKMAAVYGANASGKSNILSALSMLPKLLLHPCRDKSSFIAYDRFALDASSSAENSEMTVNFICGERKYHYETVFNNQMVAYELLQCQPFDSLRAHRVYERKTDGNTMLSTVKWGSNYAMSSAMQSLKVNLLHNRTVFGAFQMSNVDIPWMKEILDWLKDYMLPNVITGNQNLFEYTSTMLAKSQTDKLMAVDILRKADVGICGFDIEDNFEDASHTFQVRMQHTTSHGNVQLDYSQESNGTKRYYELSSILLQLVKCSHFVCIDELECRLHPELYKHFIITFLTNAKNSQMVFTTHLREFLDDNDLLRKDAIWFTEKNGDGETELYSLADFTESELSRLSVFDAYRAGRFGATPHPGNTYIDSKE